MCNNFILFLSFSLFSVLYFPHLLFPLFYYFILKNYFFQSSFFVLFVFSHHFSILLFSILIPSSPPLSYFLLAPLHSLLILIHKVWLNVLCVFSIWSKNHHFKRKK